MDSIDLLVTGASEVVTLAGPAPRLGEALDDAGVRPGAAVAADGGKIVAVGPREELERRFRASLVLDARGGVVLPGFVDPHTHPVFGATREREFDQRLRGLSYEEITRRGGGIHSSVRSLRETPSERLLDLTLERFDRMLAHGTTTIEAKSGYGLDEEEEIRSLRILHEAAARHPIEVLPTFLGAHQIPPEYAERREEYVRLVAERMIPRVAEEGLARACDVFCDEGVYTVEEARTILQAAKARGLALRVHADELALTGAARLAAELGAESADHLCRADEAAIEALAASGTTAVLLPGTVLSLGDKARPPARRMIEAGVAVALATDFNPGTSYTTSMPLIVALACTLFGMTVAEALAASTLNAAFSLGAADRVGSIEVGKQADLVLYDRPSHLFLAYELGEPAIRAVVKAGRVVYERGRDRFVRSNGADR